MSNNNHEENNEEKKLPNTAKELRGLYGVCKSTWTDWLRPLRDDIPLHTKVYTPKQVQIIVNHLGYP
jgi:hypothetical protein